MNETMRILSHQIGSKDVWTLRKQAKGKKGANRRRGARKPFVFLGVAATALVAVLVCPSPQSRYRGGVELYGPDPEAEIYGPAVPEAIVDGYTAPVIQSAVLPERTDGTEEGPLYVYASEDQKNYHMPTCRFAYASAKKLTLYEAYYLGYTPGRCCNAPSYTPDAPNGAAEIVDIAPTQAPIG